MSIDEALDALRHSDMERRFANHFIPEPNSGCWLWLGATDRRGYGQIRVRNKLRVATHVALELAGESVPSGMFACHHCDNPACVNPAHLFIGTQLENIRDCIAKGRKTAPPIAKKGQGAKTHCKRGHPLATGNLYFDRNGKRSCIQCRASAKVSLRLKLKSLGLTSRGKTPLPSISEETKLAALAMLEAGATRVAVAAHFGVSPPAIGGWKKKYNS